MGKNLKGGAEHPPPAQDRDRGRARSYYNNRNNQSRNQSYGNIGGARNRSGNNSRQINRKNPVDSSGNPSRCAICE